MDLPPPPPAPLPFPKIPSYLPCEKVYDVNTQAVDWDTVFKPFITDRQTKESLRAPTPKKHMYDDSDSDRSESDDRSVSDSDDDRGVAEDDDLPPLISMSSIVAPSPKATRLPDPIDDMKRSINTQSIKPIKPFGHRFRFAM
jgi:hypothetical protein